VKKDKKRKDKK